MYSVTGRIKNWQQPKGGYVPVKSFQRYQFDDGYQLNETENIHASLVGLAVDYLTRFMLGEDVEAVFDASLKGAYNVRRVNQARRLLNQVRGLDDRSIIAACRLSGFDMYYRTFQIQYNHPVNQITPDRATIDNIRLMTERTLAFFAEWGPVVKMGFTFEGGYSAIVSAGDGDYLTKDGLWDLKVSKNGLRSTQTLQLLMYYLMGRRSVHREFVDVNYLGVFNPRLNCAYLLPVEQIPQTVIEEVEKEVIGYGCWVPVKNNHHKKYGGFKKLVFAVLILAGIGMWLFSQYR